MSVPPLGHLKMLDLSRQLPGPFCSTLLADLGMDVLVVGAPDDPFGMGIPFLARNKRSMTLNLKTDAGREIFHRLAADVDVVLEGFRPGVTARLGVDYATLAQLNPRLVYCAITGFGQDGPYRDLVGHDLNYIATAGALSMFGRPGQMPAIPHNLIADYAGGGMHGAIGILAALMARTQTGRGQYVDISMMDGTLALMAQTFSGFFANGRLPKRGETSMDGGIPNYDVYLTKDDKYITVGAIEPWFFANLCRAMGCEQFIPHEFDSSKREEIRRHFIATFKTKTRDEWWEILTKADICAGKMNTLDEVPNDPQVLARKMIVDLDTPDGEKVKQVGISVKLSETPGSIRSLAPSLGQHTDEILADIGYDPSQIARWREDGSIA